MCKLLIAGYGRLGQLLSQQLMTDPAISLYALCRRKKPLPSNTLPLYADILSEEPLQLPAVDYLFFTATPDSRTEHAYTKCYLHGIQRVLAAIDTGRLKRVFFISSTSVYGENSGGLVDETTQPCPRGFSGRIILQAEQWLREQSQVPSTSIRFGGIYGGTRTMLMRQVREGKHLQLNQDTYTNRIHELDCVGVMAHLLNRDRQAQALEPVYIAVDSDNAKKSQVYNFLAEHQGAALLDLASGNEIGGKRCSNQQLLSTGYHLRYPSFRDGYREMLATTD